MRLLSTTSEQNLSTRNKTYFAYVCLVGNIKPGDSSAADYGANSSKRAYLLADDESEGVLIASVSYLEVFLKPRMIIIYKIYAYFFR